jgi:thiol-disulfide isomerase/thioredoxin
MNRLLYFLFALLIFTQGCDIVEGPYIEDVNNNGGNDEIVKKVLLEEFTGHQCPNCPAGAATASQIHNLYGNRFVIIAYHAGFFARTSSEFPIDYRTTTGTELNGHFGVLAYPSGIINRTSFEGTMPLDKSNWGAAAAQGLQLEPTLGLTINKQLNEATSTLTVSVSAKAIATLTPLKLCVFLTESGLISPQKTANDPNYPSGTIPNYEHKHVFRGSLNGTWGQDLFPSGAVMNQIQTITAVGSLSPNWNINHLSIVCFAYSQETGEIVQVEEEKIIE